MGQQYTELKKKTHQRCISHYKYFHSHSPMFIHVYQFSIIFIHMNPLSSIFIYSHPFYPPLSTFIHFHTFSFFSSIFIYSAVFAVQLLKCICCNAIFQCIASVVLGCPQLRWSCGSFLEQLLWHPEIGPICATTYIRVRPPALDVVTRDAPPALPRPALQKLTKPAGSPGR